MEKNEVMPIMGKFDVIKLEEFNPSIGQIDTSFERTIITFEKDSILIELIENPEIENVFQKVSNIFLQEETDQRKVHVLFNTDESKMLLLTPGNMTLSEIDNPILMIFYDEMMTTGIIFSLSRIH